MCSDLRYMIQIKEPKTNIKKLQNVCAHAQNYILDSYRASSRIFHTLYVLDTSSAVTVPVSMGLYGSRHLKAGSLRGKLLQLLNAPREITLVNHK